MLIHVVVFEKDIRCTVPYALAATAEQAEEVAIEGLLSCSADLTRDNLVRVVRVEVHNAETLLQSE